MFFILFPSKVSVRMFQPLDELNILFFPFCCSPITVTAWLPTCQKWTGSPLWRNTRGSWTAVWRRSPYWYYHLGLEWRRCIPAKVSLPEGSHLEMFCRSRDRSLWRPPKVSAIRWSFWTSWEGILITGSLTPSDGPWWRRWWLCASRRGRWSWISGQTDGSPGSGTRQTSLS